MCCLISVTFCSSLVAVTTWKTVSTDLVYFVAARCRGELVRSLRPSPGSLLQKTIICLSHSCRHCPLSGLCSVKTEDPPAGELRRSPCRSPCRGSPVRNIKPPAASGAPAIAGAPAICRSPWFNRGFMVYQGCL